MGSPIEIDVEVVSNYGRITILIKFVSKRLKKFKYTTVM